MRVRAFISNLIITAMVIAGSISVSIIIAFVYWALANAFGPSTEYHDPTIHGAEYLPNGKYLAYVGDKISVHYRVTRHSFNGDCLIDIYRVAERIGGPDDGTRILIDHESRRFHGEDQTLFPHWPDKGWQIPDLVIPSGMDEQEIALYVIARYYCNPVDRRIPRYIQGGVRPDQSEQVNLIVRRNHS